MQHSYASLYYLTYKKHVLLIILFIIIITSFVISFNTKAYSSYKTYGIYLDNHLYVDIPTDNSDVVKKGSYLKIDDEKYDIQIEEISDLQVEGNINYQTYSLKSFREYKNNQIVEMTFYYNKQRIIKKIINLIF